MEKPKEENQNKNNSQIATDKKHSDNNQEQKKVQDNEDQLKNI